MKTIKETKYRVSHPPSKRGGLVMPLYKQAITADAGKTDTKKPRRERFVPLSQRPSSVKILWADPFAKKEEK